MALYKVIFYFLFFYSYNFSQVDYASSIQPIFNNHCLSCHQYPVRSGALELDSYENLMLGDSNNGPVVLPFNADSSLLYRVLLRDSVIVPNEPICCRMPKDADPLSESQISLIYNWINEGAEEGTLIIKSNGDFYSKKNIKFLKNFPNPFNPYTNFVFEIRKTSNVTISIFESVVSNFSGFFGLKYL